MEDSKPVAVVDESEDALAMFPALETQIASTDDRRSHRRYPVGLDVRYKLSRNRRILREGHGRTRDVSKGGVLFNADQALPPGVDVELSIDWPARVPGAPAIEATICGRIVRSNSNGIAVRITGCEFGYGRR